MESAGNVPQGIAMDGKANMSLLETVFMGFIVSG